ALHHNRGIGRVFPTCPRTAPRLSARGLHAIAKVAVVVAPARALTVPLLLINVARPAIIVGQDKAPLLVMAVHKSAVTHQLPVPQHHGPDRPGRIRRTAPACITEPGQLRAKLLLHVKRGWAGELRQAARKATAGRADKLRLLVN